MKNHSVMHYNLHNIILGYAIFIVALCSCKPELDFLEDSFYSKEAALIEGKEPTQLLFDSKRGSATINLKTNGKWTISFINDRASWCSITPESGGRGIIILTVAVEKNEGYSERSASILFSCKDVTQTIVVTQKQNDAILISSSKVEVPSSGGMYNVELKHNIDYSVSQDEQSKDWLSILSTKDLQVDKIHYSVKSNEDIAVRIGKILITSNLGEETINVYQSGATPVLVLTQNEYVVSHNEEIINVDIKSNVNYSWEIIEGADWIQTVNTKSLSTHRLSFFINSNSSYDTRTGKILFSDNDTGLQEVVTVIQKQKDAILLTQNEYVLSDNGGMISIEVKSNVVFKYMILEGADWIKEVNTKSLSTHQLSFMINANTTYDDRTGKILFCNNETGLEEVVTIIQKAKSALILTPNEYTVSDEGEIIDIDIASNIEFEYEITEGVDWIKEINTKSLSSSTLSFHISKNTSFWDRTGIIVFKNKDSGINATVIITQIQSQVEKKVLKEILEACTDINLKNSLIYGNWGSNHPLSEWRGIEINETGRISSINIFYCGTIPQSIGRLQDLTVFNIDSPGNGIPSLYSFPDSLCRCTKLEEIRINSGSFSSIPNSISKLNKLHTLNLSWNQFTSFPSQLCDCSNLEELYIRGMDINTVPESISNLNKLRVIDLSNNQLTYFPTQLCYCSNLEEIMLQFNHMAGSLPEIIGYLKKLKYLCLSNNYTLSGKLPSSLLTLPCWQAFPLDIVSNNNMDVHLDDFIAPSFKVVDIDGKQLNSDYLYQNQKYTILVSGYRMNPLPPDLLRVYEDYSDDVEIVLFEDYLFDEEDIRKYKRDNNISFPCVSMTDDMIISGQTKHLHLFGKMVSAKTITVIDSNGKVVYFNGLETINGIYEFVSGQSYYVSTDYSQDKKVITLQTAKEGKGIDIVIMGDAYSDKFIKDGSYMNDMQLAMEAFFEEEPFLSFRHLFNVNTVVAVSKNDIYDKDCQTQTVFKLDVSNASGIRCPDLGIIDEYTLLALNEDRERLKNTTVIIVVRGNSGRSVDLFYWNPQLGYQTDYAFCLRGNDENLFRYIVKHEAGGHGFGKLADEYVDYSLNSSLSSLSNKDLIDYVKSFHIYFNAYKNIDITNDPSKVLWSHFLKDSRYDGTVGIYEGALLLPNRVFRATQNSIMNNSQVDGFNAPSREEIYYRIHKLAYGDDWKYDFEKFVEYDIKNIKKTAPSVIQQKSLHENVNLHELTAPPIIIMDQ